MGDHHGEMRGPGELINFQGSHPPCSRMVHPHAQEATQQWQEACMGEKGAPGKTQTSDRSVQEVEVGTGDQGSLETLSKHTTTGLGKSKPI